MNGGPARLPPAALALLVWTVAPVPVRADAPGTEPAIEISPPAAPPLSAIALELEPPRLETEAVRGITFEEVLDIALEENLDLRLARAEAEIARARARGTTGTLFPEIRFGAGTAETDGRVQGSFGALRDVDFDTVNPTVALTYRVNIGARLLDAFAARSELDAATYGVLDTRQRLLLRVAELYNDLALAQVGVRIARQRAEDGDRFLKIAEARQRTGLGLGSDVVRARAELARDRQDLIRAREVWETTSVRLAVVLRLEAGPLLAAKEERLAPLEFEAAWAGLDVEENARDRPDVTAFRKRAVAAARRFTAAWLDLAVPEVTAQLRETWIGTDASDLDDRRNSGVFVGWTLSFQKVARIRERGAERTTSYLEALRREDRAAGEARSAFRRVRAARERLPLAWEGLEAARQSHRISLAQFKSGTAIALEVLDAADRLARARLDVARSIVDYNLSQVRLLAATGVLQAEVLRAADDGGSP